MLFCSVIKNIFIRKQEHWQKLWRSVQIMIIRMSLDHGSSNKDGDGGKLTHFDFSHIHTPHWKYAYSWKYGYGHLKLFFSSLDA